jgi:hypothetical protein
MRPIARQLIIKIDEGKTLTIEKPLIRIPSFRELGFLTEDPNSATDCVVLRDVYTCMGELMYRPVGVPMDLAYGSDANSYINNQLSWITQKEYDSLSPDHQ